MEQIKVFNKLVRDKIPEIIKSKGEQPECETLSENEFLQKLKEKLIEECNEVVKAESKQEVCEELADVMEVILHIAKIYNLNFEGIEKARIEKNEKRGSFNSKIFLKTVTLAKNF